MKLLQLALVGSAFGLMTVGAACFLAVLVSLTRAMVPPPRNRYR